jgi:competence protein ComEC
VLRLDTVVLTHADIDHAGGLATVLREFRPFDVWEGTPVPALPLLQQLRAGAARGGARWSNVQQGDCVLVDGVQITVHHPRLADWERQVTRNDDSVVLELRWRNVSVVFSGDIGREAEASIAPRFEKVPIRVLKVPHHGSLTSSTPAFLAALEPRVAVFSAGRGNAFGHPAPAVLERYQQLGTTIFRTDQDGAVSLTTDGYRLEVRTFTGRKLSAGAAVVERSASRPSTQTPSPRGSDRRTSGHWP